MKLNRKSNKVTKFGNLKIGDAFIYGGDNTIMIKIEPRCGEIENSIELPSCKLYNLSDCSEVYLVECEINITE